MADPINDALIGQVFPGELCHLFIGSYNETLKEYSAYISGFERSGADYKYGVERSSGMYGVSREGVKTPMIISFNAVFIGSPLPEISFYNGSVPFTGYKEWSLTNDDKKFKVKMEFVEPATDTVGSPINTADVAYKEIYYNSRSININLKNETDGYAEATISFWMSPFNDLGSSNFRSLYKQPGTSIANWVTAENQWDTDLSWS